MIGGLLSAFLALKFLFDDTQKRKQEIKKRTRLSSGGRKNIILGAIENIGGQSVDV